MQNHGQRRSGLDLLKLYMGPSGFLLFVILILLLLTLLIGTGEMIHGQLLRMGERLYGNPSHGYAVLFFKGRAC